MQCAEELPACASVWAQVAPPAFSVVVDSSQGPFTVHVNTSWAPPFAQRFYTLVLLSYFDGAPLYRVLPGFVSQFGYRAVPEVDAAWLALQLSNVTWPLPFRPANTRGTVAFGTGSVVNNGSDPSGCTAAQCSQGFSVELFINTADNSGQLDPCDFSPFGWVEPGDMGVVDAFYSAYGECSDLCESEGPSPDQWCYKAPGGQGFAGVNLTAMIDQGHPYLDAGFPRLDYVRSVRLV